MSDKMHETLSAMVDGEANELELRRALTTMSDDDSQTWRRYQLVSSLLRQDKTTFMSSDISAAVSAAVATEKTPKRAANAWKPVASFAVAASVTLALFVGLQWQQTTDLGASPAVAEVDVETIANEAANRVAAGSQGLSLAAGEGFATASAHVAGQSEQLATERAIADAIAAERLQTYLEQHTAHSAANSNQGVLPFVRVEEAQAQ